MKIEEAIYKLERLLGVVAGVLILVMFVLGAGVLLKWQANMVADAWAIVDARELACTEVCEQKGLESRYGSLRGCECKDCSIYETSSGSYQSCDYEQIFIYKKQSD